MNTSNSSANCSQQSKIMEEVMMSGNIPIPAPGRSGMMGGGGGVVPPALLDESRVPRFYRDAIAACGATQHSMLPHTALVYNLMVTSGLPRPVLSYIWSAVNRTLPGQLTRPEFFSCLALIALAQKGESLVALSTMSSLPIPFLQPFQVPAGQSLSAPLINVAKPPSLLTSKQQWQASSFIPTSLLLGRRNNVKKKEVDLLGEPITPSEMKLETVSTQSETQGSLGDHQASVCLHDSALNDLCGIDLSSIASTQSTTDLFSSTTNNFSNEGNDIDAQVSTASRFSMSSSTASEISVSTHVAPIISTELSECWQKIVVAATEIFKNAENLLGSATDSVLREIAQTERGDSYLRCLNRLYFVICRVERSAGVDLPKRCVDKIIECSRIWKRLSSFIQGEQEVDEGCADSEKHCAICCQPVSNAVFFGGQTYHSECANLWVNDVNSMLPNMHLLS
ncbi:hypothetical protein DICVIV_10216 [Dictyocaulus viviparus]|uniref:EH domain-containing protein n=1 Tax=Dictyocaulus viviparus TaxID=29172 RepID=A0A0D8XJ02_DICVI|nr:hypothetical protein DICVIV_10216 [Dictyocaulus viviparus]